GYILSPAPRAHVLSCVFTPGSRTHRGLHSVARCAGSGLCWSSFPRFADSPGATFCRPLRGLMSFLVSSPPVRGLTGGYILSPAARARVFLVSSPPVRGLTGGYILSPAARAHVLSCVFTPGSRTHRGLHSVAR